MWWGESEISFGTYDDNLINVTAIESEIIDKVSVWGVVDYTYCIVCWKL